MSIGYWLFTQVLGNQETKHKLVGVIIWLLSMKIGQLLNPTPSADVIVSLEQTTKYNVLAGSLWKW